MPVQPDLQPLPCKNCGKDFSQHVLMNAGANTGRWYFCSNDVRDPHYNSMFVMEGAIMGVREGQEPQRVMVLARIEPVAPMTRDEIINQLTEALQFLGLKFEDQRWQYMHANGQWSGAPNVAQAAMELRHLYVLTHEDAGRQRLRGNHYAAEDALRVRTAVEEAVRAMREQLERALRRKEWWKRQAKKRGWLQPKKRKMADTGVFPNRRRLTEDEARKGHLPEPHTDEEWENMLPHPDLPARRERNAKRQEASDGNKH